MIQNEMNLLGFLEGDGPAGRVEIDQDGPCMAPTVYDICLSPVRTR